MQRSSGPLLDGREAAAATWGAVPCGRFYGRAALAGAFGIKTGPCSVTSPGRAVCRRSSTTPVRQHRLGSHRFRRPFALNDDLAR